jgi:amino acid adenylation domain-containing protein
MSVDTPTRDARQALFDPEQSLPARVRAQVALRGSHPAIATGAWQPTYAELDAVANRLAHELIAAGMMPGDRLAILMRHDGPQIAAMLAALKAGAIVVVLNRTDPPGRLREVLGATEPSLIVTDADSGRLAAQVWGRDDGGVMSFDPQTLNGPAHDPAIEVSPSATAVLIYTSGSSGRPKVVMQTHRFVLHNALRHTVTQRLRPDDRIALLASLSGAQGMGTAWSALANGAILFLHPTMEQGVADLASWLNEHRVTIYVSASSVHRHFMRTLDDGASFPTVRLVQITSEWATADDFRTFQRYFVPGCEFIHGLGSSETGNVTRLRLVHGDVVGDGRLSIGQPSEGMQVLIVNEAGRAVAPGETGEMMVRSRFLTGGYWRDPVLTQQRFSTDPATGLMTYRGGDLARVNARGLLEFMGRRDAAVKVGGFYVDPAEVEEALLRLPGVERAAVVPRSRSNGEAVLAAYVQLRDRQTQSADAVRRALQAILPRYMVPPIIQLPDTIPLTPQGKIDRERLKRELSAPAAGGQGEPPVTATEAVIAEAWAVEFQLECVGRQDDFFDLGGDSLIAAVVAARIHEALGLQISIGTFFDHPVLADLARVIDAQEQPSAVDAAALGPVARPVARDGRIPLSFGQEFYCQTSQRGEQSALHVATSHFRVVGPLNKDILQESINDTAQRHEILRTSFSLDGPPAQLVHPAVTVPLAFHDFAGDPDAASKARRVVKEVTSQPFDIARLPLFRFTLVRFSENEHWLLFTHHHVIWDGWSSNIFFRELGRIYEARLEGRGDPGLDPPRQYEDYARWQRKTFHPTSPAYRSELAWWMNHLLAAVYPDRPNYRRALLERIHHGSPVPRFIKKSIGTLLRGLLRISTPVAPELPFGRAKVLSGLDPAEGFMSLTLAPDTSRRLSELGRRAGATHFAVRLAGYAAMLAAQSGNPTVSVGTYFSTRNRAVTRDLIGFCANHAMLVLHCDGTQSFRNFIVAVRDHLRAIQGHGEFPYEIVHDEARAWRVRLPQIRSHVSIAIPHADITFAGLRLSHLRHTARASMPPGFEVRFDQGAGTDDCTAVFDAHVYDPAAVRVFLGRFVRLLDVVSHNPDIAVAGAVALAAREGDAGARPQAPDAKSIRAGMC